MALDYTEEYSMQKNKKNVVFCLYKQKNDGNSGQINMPLEMIQKELIALNNNDGMKIEKAFVYGKEKVCIKAFADCDLNTIYFLQNEMCNVSISQLLFISLHLLEQKWGDDNCAQNELYLIIDGEYSHVESKKMFEILKEYSERISYKPILVIGKNEREKECHEEYINKQGEIRSFSDYQKKNIVGD